MAAQHDPRVNVQENIRNINVYIISEAHKKANEYHTILKTYYSQYLRLYRNQFENPQGVNVDGTRLTDETFKEAESEYNNFDKTLKKINKHIDKDFQYAAEVGKDVITYFQKAVSTKHDIDNTTLQPDSVEKNKKLRKLYKKYRKSIDKYNKSATEFNQCVTEYQAVSAHLQQGIISIPSWTSNTRYSISLEKIENWAKRLSETDELSKLRDEIKRIIESNQPTQPPQLDMTSLNLIPIQMMTPTAAA